MDKLSRVNSKDVWRCQVCEFDNFGLMGKCEMCDTIRSHQQKKDDGVKGQKEIIVEHVEEKVIVCLDTKCKTKNAIDEIKCTKCGKFLVEGLDDDQQDQQKQEASKKEQQKKIETVPCSKCSFQNDPTNVTCVSCDAKLRKKRAPPKPKVRAPKYMGPNFCYNCNSYRTYSTVIGGEMQCKCPDPDDGIPLEKGICNYCFKHLESGQYDKHVKECKEKEIFFDRAKNKSYERCTALQIDTMIYMHRKCEKLHFGRQKKLEKRIQKLGYVKKDLQNLYHYIVNYAPIIIHMHADRHFEFFVKDTHYRSQFETSKSSGSLSRSSRINWEDRMFDNAHHNAKDSERVKYGTMNFTNDPSGVAVCSSYGQSYFLLKEHVRDRCTMTDMDSSSPNSTICTFRFCYHLLCKLSDNEIKAAFDGSKAQQIKSAGVVGTYKEIQIHGPVEFKKDIERVYIHKAEIAMNPKCLDQVEEFCKNNGLKYETFGEVPKPIVPGAGIFGGGMYGGLGGVGLAPAPFTGSVSIFGGGGLAFGSGGFGAPYIPPVPYKAPPIKYAPVSFPYSSIPPKHDQSESDQDYI